MLHVRVYNRPRTMIRRNSENSPTTRDFEIFERLSSRVCSRNCVIIFIQRARVENRRLRYTSVHSTVSLNGSADVPSIERRFNIKCKVSGTNGRLPVPRYPAACNVKKCDERTRRRRRKRRGLKPGTGPVRAYRVGSALIKGERNGIKPTPRRWRWRDGPAAARGDGGVDGYCISRSDSAAREKNVGF